VTPSLPRRVARTYRRIGHTYWAWFPTILVLSIVVFIPLGAIDTLVANADVESLDLGSGLKVAALALAIGAITTTGLLGEVFFSGAVAVSLTSPRDEPLPSMLQIARKLRYGRLIGVDLVYVLIVAVGLILFIFPGAIAFVLLGLAGPIVELEERTVRGALKRSLQLVRGNFWFVFWILVPIEIAGDAIGEGITEGVHAVLGHGFLAGWAAESLANVLVSPLFAVAAVLLTIELITTRDGDGPRINHAPPLVTA
jgi:hypothetical protein